MANKHACYYSFNNMWLYLSIDAELEDYPPFGEKIFTPSEDTCKKLEPTAVLNYQTKKASS
jgi:hypothetical protein